MSTSFVDDDGTTRFRGTLVGDVGPPTVMEVVSSSGTPPGSGVDPGGVSLPFAHGSGGTLLDYTDPTAPTVIDAGTYAVSIDFSAEDAAGKLAEFVLGLPVNSLAAGRVLESTTGISGLSIAATLVLLAGDTLTAFVKHNAAAALGWSLSGYVVKLK